MVARVDPRTGNLKISGIQSTPSKTGLIDRCLFGLKTTLAWTEFRWIGAQHGASWQAFLRVQQGKSYSGLENDSRRMNFGAMELNAMIHDLEQQEMANQTRGPVRDGYKRPFHCIPIRK
jgi:hypothetical protein